jgi:hopanoid biosynthesis associated RND transporter like protein HpnN
MWSLEMADPTKNPRRVVPRIVGFCSAHSLVMTLVVLVLGIASGIYAARHLGIETDMTRLISPHVGWRLNEEALDRAFPQDVDLIAAVVDAPSDALAADAAEALVQRLKARPDLFRVVRDPDGGAFLRKEGLLLLPLAEVKKKTDQLRQSYPLFAALTHDRSLRGLIEFVRLAIEHVSKHPAAAEEILPLLRILSAGCDAVLKTPPGAPVPPLDWEAAAEHRPPRVHRRIVLAQAIPHPGAIAPAALPLAFLRAAAQDLELTPDRGYRVRLTGRAAIDTEQLESVRKDSLFRFALSIGLLLAVVLAALRSFRLLAATVATVLVGLVLTSAFAAVAVGELNLISMAFAVLFCGLSVDFTIQFGVAFRSVRAGAAGTEHALVDTGRRVGGPIILAAAATASGFFAFLPTAFRGVAELGLIAGAGMLIAAALTLTLLPALYVQLGTRNVPPPRSAARWFSNADELVRRYRQMVLAGTAILAIVAAVVLPRLSFDTDQLSMLDPSSEAVTTFRDLARDPDNSPFEVDVLVPSLGAARSLAQQLETLPEVDHAVTLASFVPDEQAPKLELVEDVAEILGPGLAVAGGGSLPPPDAAAQTQALSGTIAALEKAAPMLQADRRLRERLAEVAASAQRVAQLQAVLLADPLALMVQVKEALSAAPATLADLPKDLRREWVAPDGEAKISVFPKGNANDPVIRTRFVRAVLRVAPNAAGTPIQFIESAGTVAGAFARAGAYAIGAILLLVGMTLRRGRDMLLVLGPLLFAGLFTLATLAGLGLALDFANVIALPLLLGIGVAFDIYFVANWRAGEQHPLASPTARAVVFSALATGSAFGSLALSRYPGMSHLGLLLSIELSWTLACTLVLLPALLASIPRDR